LKDALGLTVRVLSKTLDMTKLTADKLEMATLTRENNRTRIRILPQSEVVELIKAFEVEEEKKAEAAKREKEKLSDKGSGASVNV